MAKVIRPGNMFFEDDIKIIDAELDCSLNIPQPIPIFSADELQIFYNGHIFRLADTPADDAYAKVYTMIFGLRESDSPKKQEENYFKANQAAIDKIKERFIERVINGLSESGAVSSTVTKMKMPQLGQELAERIAQRYATLKKLDRQQPAGAGLIGKLDDASVFNLEMSGCERVLIIDSKIYSLTAFPEYVSMFEKSFEKDFFKKFVNACKTEAPENLSKMLMDNRDKVHRKVLPQVRNKIYHSSRSAKLYLDGTYWTPHFIGGSGDLITSYQNMLEKQIKIDAARSLK